MYRMKSMTGFGRGINVYETGSAVVEIKTVNHKFTDFSLKAPREIVPLEDKIRNMVYEVIGRGKIDVYISYQNTADLGSKLIADCALISSYIQAYRNVAEKFDLKDDIGPNFIMSIPGAFTTCKLPDSMEEAEERDTFIWRVIKPALSLALEELCRMRTIEGNKLKEYLQGIRSNVLKYFDNISKRQGLVPIEYRDKLHARIKELLDTQIPDNDRLALEVALFADKCCIDEEVSRFRSHLSQMDRLLNECNDSKEISHEKSLGKKFDFLLQEMNREVNTMGSKANDIEITRNVMALKGELEKMREQVQNIE